MKETASQHAAIFSDIDECANGTHNCSADAVCDNTKGSHNCTCNAGYYGDGRDCQTGELNHFPRCVLDTD